MVECKGVSVYFQWGMPSKFLYPTKEEVGQIKKEVGQISLGTCVLEYEEESKILAHLIKYDQLIHCY